ncbi:MAG: transcriptional regulator, partial [Dehalococcoidia bacterium]|nr:transcriptional regulator [Dehalococcoidia bacterium]
VERLVEYALRIRVAAVVKRIGWALEALNAPADVLVPLRAYPAKGDSPLDPGRPSRGRHNRAWHVIENLHVAR